MGEEYRLEEVASYLQLVVEASYLQVEEACQERPSSEGAAWVVHLHQATWHLGEEAVEAEIQVELLDSLQEAIVTLVAGLVEEVITIQLTILLLLPIVLMVVLAVGNRQREQMDL